MKKKLFLTVLLAVFIAITCRAEELFVSEEVPGYKASWVNPSVDLREYEVIFIDTVNVDKVELESDDLDLDDDNYGPRETEWRRKRTIAYKTARIFEKALSKVMPVVRNSDKIEGRKALILEMSLQGHVNETRLLSNLLPGSEGRRASVSIRCDIADHATEKKIISVADTYISGSPEENASLLEVDDLDAWYGAMKIWANDLAIFIGRKRG